MYVIKNALRNINRSKGRNLLIGIIVFVIAVSACVALSIQRAADTAKDNTLESMSVTGGLTLNRTSLMTGQTPDSSGKNQGAFDRSQMKDRLESYAALPLEDYMTYAAYLEEGDSCYYSYTVSLNAAEGLYAYGTSEEDSEEEEGEGDIGGRAGYGEKNNMQSFGDFSVTGYSSDAAMTQFGTDGTCAIMDGSMFEEQTEDYTCVISSELAVWNGLGTGDTLTLVNPQNEEQQWTLTISGIYSNSAAGMGSNPYSVQMDAANQIYMSANALNQMAAEAEESEAALSPFLSFTYWFQSAEHYYTFEEKISGLLPDNYTLTSSEIAGYEASLVPLENLSRMAQWFLAVVLAVGAIILVVLNIFNIRNRKYEVGVLTAIGMKKRKVAAQFVCEILIVMLCSILIGAGIGAAVSVPVSNALLENQIESAQESTAAASGNFGRDTSMKGGNGPEAGFMENAGQQGGGIRYMSSIGYAVDLTVIAKLIGIGILLALVSGLAAVVFIMRYEPLQILSNRE